MSANQVKVLHVMPQLAFAGAELQLYNLIVNSDKQKIKHTVLYYEDSNPNAIKMFKDAGIPLVYVTRDKKRPFSFFLSMRKRIVDVNPDIVHCWLFSASVWGRWAAIFA